MFEITTKKLDVPENEQAEIEIMQRHADVKSLRGTLKVDPEPVDEIIAEFAGALTFSARSRLGGIDL